MQIYAGIDEAGYGPLLGPLVVARSVFVLASRSGDEPPPCLWRELSPQIGRAGEGAGLLVDDSKRLYARGSLAGLEPGVFALLPGPDPPVSLDELLERLAVDASSRRSMLPWYAAAGGGPALPVRVPRDVLGARRAETRAILAARGVEVREVRATVVYEDRFNGAVLAAGNKADATWGFVAEHLGQIWEAYGELAPLVVLDRQGGRRYYGSRLQRLFPGACCEADEQSPEASRYLVREGGRSLRLEVRCRCESSHLPAALASMVAKYLRELLMARFRAYWSRVAPEVRPTAGYPADGRRFLSEIEPHLRRLQVEPSSLARVR